MEEFGFKMFLPYIQKFFDNFIFGESISWKELLQKIFINQRT